MASTPEVVEPLKEEAIVYFVVSPDSGQGHRIYADEESKHWSGSDQAASRLKSTQSSIPARLIRTEFVPLVGVRQNGVPTAISKRLLP